MNRILLITCVLSLGASHLFAQDDIVISQLNEVESRMADDGYRMSSESSYLWLDDDETQSMEIRLVSGNNYQIWGVCDGDCSDLDLELLDAYGNKLDEDILDDDVPLIDPQNPQTGIYTLRVKMHECSVEPCKVGIGYFATSASGSNNGGSGGSIRQGILGDGGSISGNDITEDGGSGPQEVVDAQLDVLETSLSDGSFSRSHDREYLWLDDDETKTFSIDLNSSYNYQIWGVCDGDCGDLDMVLLDAYGNKVDEDVLDDAQPLLDPSNPQTGPYTIEVKMYDCEVEPCLVGLTFFRQ